MWVRSVAYDARRADEEHTECESRSEEDADRRIFLDGAPPRHEADANGDDDGGRERTS